MYIKLNRPLQMYVLTLKHAFNSGIPNITFCGHTPEDAFVRYFIHFDIANQTTWTLESSRLYDSKFDILPDYIKSYLNKYKEYV